MSDHDLSNSGIGFGVDPAADASAPGEGVLTAETVRDHLSQLAAVPEECSYAFTALDLQVRNNPFVLMCRIGVQLTDQQHYFCRVIICMTSQSCLSSRICKRSTWRVIV